MDSMNNQPNSNESETLTLPKLPDGWYWNVKSDYNSARGTWNTWLYLSSKDQGAMDWERVTNRNGNTIHPDPVAFTTTASELLTRYNKERVDNDCVPLTV